jgi:PIN domain nuclease of toxin-antitoxin system
VTLLLDTHVLLWWQAGGERLSRRAGTAIHDADRVLISPLTCWELATLHRRGRILLDREPTAWVADLLQSNTVRLAQLSAEAATWAGQLDDAFPGDPIDRLLYATARDLRIPLVTKDGSIRAFAAASRDVTVLW